MQPRQVFFGDRPPAPTEEGRERSRVVARRLGQPAEQPSLDIHGLLATLERGHDCGGVGGLEHVVAEPEEDDPVEPLWLADRHPQQQLRPGRKPDPSEGSVRRQDAADLFIRVCVVRRIGQRQRRPVTR